MYDAEISIKYPSSKFANSVMKALTPDNLMASRGMRIVSNTKGSILRVRVEKCERMESLQATIQDVFRCLHAAESSLAKIASR
jgi:tRNA threonylcarbamoyladenosine modification (KEOPS) complex  Pcc1 subunit